MSQVGWVERAASKDLDPRVRIMRPREINYQMLEPQVTGLVRALNQTGVVETLWSCAGHPFEAPDDQRRSHAALILLHVLDERGWRELTVEIAQAVRRLGHVTISVTLAHESQFWLDVPHDLPPSRRRAVLDEALAAAAQATTALAPSPHLAT